MSIHSYEFFKPSKTQKWLKFKILFKFEINLISSRWFWFFSSDNWLYYEKLQQSSEFSIDIEQIFDQRRTTQNYFVI